MRSVLPGSLDDTKILTEFKFDASLNHIEIIAYHKCPINRGEQHWELPFAFHTRGRYHDYGRLFAQLADNKRLVEIKALQIKRGETDNEGYLDGWFVVSAFVFHTPTKSEIYQILSINHRQDFKQDPKRPSPRPHYTYLPEVLADELPGDPMFPPRPDFEGASALSHQGSDRLPYLLSQLELRGIYRTDHRECALFKIGDRFESYSPGAKFQDADLLTIKDDEVVFQFYYSDDEDLGIKKIVLQLTPVDH
jgi:hypothetical protein